MRPASPIRTVLVTGASSGIGSATARVLTDAGYEVWGTSRDVSRLPERPRFHPVRLDVNDAASMQAAVDQVRAEAGAIDALINNAGEVINAPLEVLAADGLQQQFQTLFFGPVELIRLVLPEMRQRNSGLIVNVTSLAARFPVPFNAGYSAAKAALSSATECLRLELVGTGIRLVDLQPGDVATPMLRRTRELNTGVCAAYEPNLRHARDAEATKDKQSISPDKVARVISRLMRDASPPPHTFVGNFFEARVATLADRLLPRRTIEWAQRRLYDLK